MSDRQLHSYPLPMMPDVDYQIVDDDVELVTFESHVMKNCMAFFDRLKETLAVHHVAQTPEYLIDSMSEEVPSRREYLRFAIKSIDHFSEETAHLIQAYIDQKQAESFIDGTVWTY